MEMAQSFLQRTGVFAGVGHLVFGDEPHRLFLQGQILPDLHVLKLFNLLNGGGPILRAAHAVHLTALSFLPARPDFLYNEDKEQGTQNS